MFMNKNVLSDEDKPTNHKKGNKRKKKQKLNFQ